MADLDDTDKNLSAIGGNPELPFKRVRNLGEPIKLTDVNISGISAEASSGGQKVEVITRASMISTQSFFHRVAPNIVNGLEAIARRNGYDVSLLRASSILVVIRKDDTADMWIDAAAVAMDARLKIDVNPGRVIMQDDIADITAVWFPDVDISPDCRIIYIFREGFRFGLMFDLRTDVPLDISGMKKQLALLLRRMRYADVYSMLADEETLGKIIDAGWFPFIEIMTSEFKSLSELIESGLSLEDAEEKLLSKFTNDRINNMFDRWMKESHFRHKEEILRAGVDAYIEGKYVACLKIILTEIEGLIAAAYEDNTGQTTRNTSKLMEFAVDSAIRIAGGDDTLFFPVGFGQYLKDYTFGDSAKRSASRHAIGHGRAKASDYTQVRALQAILTLDQLAHYS